MEATKSIADKEPKLNRPRQKDRSSYWEHLLSRYEMRNASLEKRQAALAEKVKFMECALPSLLMGAVINSSLEPGNSMSSSKTRDSKQKGICADDNIKD